MRACPSARMPGKPGVAKIEAPERGSRRFGLPKEATDKGALGGGLFFTNEKGRL